MKVDKNYKMSKTLKTSLTLGRFKNKQQRDEWKKIMIAAEAHSRTVDRVIFN